MKAAATLALAVAVAALAVGCGGDDDAPVAAGGSAGAGGKHIQCRAKPDDDVLPAEVPPKPPSATALAGASGSRTFAVTRLFLDVATTPDEVAAGAGYKHASNLDGLHLKDANAPGHCRPSYDCSRLDGPGGRDNAFSEFALPIFLGLVPSLPQDTTDAVAQGSVTLALRVRNLGPDQSYNGLSADALAVRGTPSGAGFQPVVDMSSYAWRPLSDQLAEAVGSGDALVASSSSQRAYLVDDMLVVENLGVVELPLWFYKFPLFIPIHNARITGRLSADHTSIEDGQIVGIIPTSLLELRAREAALRLGLGCGGGTEADNVLRQIKDGNDLMLSGTQDPAASCDGTSIGVGFRAELTTLGEAAPPEPPPTCAK